MTAVCFLYTQTAYCGTATCLQTTELYLQQATLASEPGAEFAKYLTIYRTICLQCFDAVGWAAGRASGL